MLGFCLLNDSYPDHPVYPVKTNPLLPLVIYDGSFCFSSKETAEQSECEARIHEEGEVGKPSPE